METSASPIVICEPVGIVIRGIIAVVPSPKAKEDKVPVHVPVRPFHPPPPRDRAPPVIDVAAKVIEFIF